MIQFPFFEKFSLYDESIVTIATTTSSPFYIRGLGDNQFPASEIFIIYK